MGKKHHNEYEDDHDSNEIYESFDLDGDGTIENNERLYDLDNDGDIDGDDQLLYIEQYDLNDDGIVEQNELEYEQYDLNRDGIITDDEKVYDIDNDGDIDGYDVLEFEKINS